MCHHHSLLEVADVLAQHKLRLLHSRAACQAHFLVCVNSVRAKQQQKLLAPYHTPQEKCIPEQSVRAMHLPVQQAAAVGRGASEG